LAGLSHCRGATTAKWLKERILEGWVLFCYYKNNGLIGCVVCARVALTLEAININFIIEMMRVMWQQRKQN